jgi:hypothetical protein
MPDLIPYPQSLKAKDASFSLTADTPIVAPGELEPEARLLSGYLAAAFGRTRPTAPRATASGPANVTLVRDGKPAATIVVSDSPAPAATLAALELQYVTKQITGAELPIKMNPEEATGTRILIGDSKATRARGIKAADFGNQEYLIDFAKDTVLLFGPDDRDSSGIRIDYSKATSREGRDPQMIQLPGMYDNQGSLKATYDFLERFCGVRFYGPKAFMVHFPQQDHLVIEGRRIKRAPAIKYTNGLCSDQGGLLSWPLQQNLYDNPSSEETLLFARRLRTGGKNWYVNHTFQHLKYKKRFLKQDPREPEVFEGYRPEFFPPEGCRANQPCYTSEPLAKQVARDAADFFDNKLGNKQHGLDAFVGKSDFFPVVPLDCGNYCTCENCRELLAKGKGKKAAPFNSGETSYYVFNFVNMVAREVRKTHPDKWVGALAYEQYYWKPQGLEIEKNVAVAPCVVVCNWWHNDTRNNEMKWYKEWVRDHRERGAPLYLWIYYHHPEEIGVMRGHKVFPHFSAHDNAEQAQMFARDGVQGIFLCGWGEGFDFYMTMKFFDDPTQDIDTVFNEFFKKFFGAAAEPMKEFYLLMEETGTNPNNYPQDRPLSLDVFWSSLGSRERLTQLQSHIDKANQLATTDLEKRRVSVWGKGVMQYMWDGHNAYQERSNAKAPHSSVAKTYIHPVSVHASTQDVSPITLVTGFQMIESPHREFGSKNAKLDIRTDKDRHWHGFGEATWVMFDLGDLYDLDEIRIWNYQQNRGYRLTRRGMRNVVIEGNATSELSTWQLIGELEIPEGDDDNAFAASAIVPGKKTRCRFVRITSVGTRGHANWQPADSKEIATGLGQVRFYGTQLK